MAMRNNGSTGQQKYETTKIRDCETTRMRNNESTKQRNCETTNVRCETTKERCETTRLRNIKRAMRNYEMAKQRRVKGKNKKAMLNNETAKQRKGTGHHVELKFRISPGWWLLDDIGLLAQFSLYVHKYGLKPHSFHLDDIGERQIPQNILQTSSKFPQTFSSFAKHSQCLSNNSQAVSHWPIIATLAN